MAARPGAAYEPYMTAADTQFAGSIPALYDRHLGPLLFAPYAWDMAARVVALAPGDIVETAAGSGIVTAALAAALPQARIVATDLNQGMLDVAAAKPELARVRFEAADAQSLPLPGDAFDVAVCQFGMMFFPDRVLAAREARRVLRPGGRFLFNVWDALEQNPVSAAVHEALVALFPGDPPGFLPRTPFGYHNPERIEADLRAAGFANVRIDTVVLSSRVDARMAALGLTKGSPLRAEIEARGNPDDALRAAEAALAPFDGHDAPMSALVVNAG